MSCTPFPHSLFSLVTTDNFPTIVWIHLSWMGGFHYVIRANTWLWCLNTGCQMFCWVTVFYFSGLFAVCQNDPSVSHINIQLHNFVLRTYMHLSAYLREQTECVVLVEVDGVCMGGGATFRGFAVIIWQNAGKSLRVLSRGSRVRGPSTMGWVICKCHSGGVLSQPTGRERGERGSEGGRMESRWGGGGGGGGEVLQWSFHMSILQQKLRLSSAVCLHVCVYETCCLTFRTILWLDIYWKHEATVLWIYPFILSFVGWEPYLIASLDLKNSDLRSATVRLSPVLMSWCSDQRAVVHIV